MPAAHLGKAKKLNIYRPDIDGLRAIAVTSVVIYHASHYFFPSGFLGVDIFFAISGYLIGGIIFEEIKENKFTFAGFYARRARRILPALIGVLATFSVLGVFFYSPFEMRRFGYEELSAMLGASNMFYWWNTDYFAQTSETHPLLMTWSLGVEEQFYVIFPFVLIFASKFDKKIRAIILVSIIIVSLLVSHFLSRTYPSSAFYLLPPRIWELGMGVTLAIIHRDYEGSTKLKGMNNEIASFVGLALILASLSISKNDAGFSELISIAPVVGTIVLINSRGSFINKKILGNKLFSSVGLISYSWYLWHWPMMALARRIGDYPPSSAVMLSVAVLSLVMGYLSWMFVERPFRKSPLPPAATLRRYGLVLVVFSLIPLSCIVTKGWPMRVGEGAKQVSQLEVIGSGVCLAGFNSDKPVASPLCNPPGATVALIGDSHAAALSPGLRDALAHRGEKLLELTKAACMPLSGVTTASTSNPLDPAACLRFMTAAQRRISGNPALRLVVIAGSWPNSEDDRFTASSPGQPNRSLSSKDAVTLGLPAMIDEFQRAGKQVVVIGDVPRFDFDPMRHASADDLPLRQSARHVLDGARAIDGDTVDQSHIDKRFDQVTKQISEIAASRPGTRYLSIRDQLCIKIDKCAFAKDGIPYFHDQHHLSLLGAKYINWDKYLY